MIIGPWTTLLVGILLGVALTLTGAVLSFLVVVWAMVRRARGTGRQNWASENVRVGVERATADVASAMSERR